MENDGHYYFICNPAANRGRLAKQWNTIKNTIDTYIDPHQYDWDFTTAPLQSHELVHTALKSGYSHIISVGGDGIANEITNILAKEEHPPIFGMIPGGTANDSQKTYRMPEDPIETIQHLFDGYIENFPIGKVTGDFENGIHYFIDHTDCGLGAMAAQSDKKGSKLLKGEWRYIYYALKNLIRYKNNHGKVIIDGEEFEGDFSAIAIGFGSHMSILNMWPGNHIGMGDFGIILARGQSKFGLAKLMIAAREGNHLGRDGIEYLRGRTIEIELEREWPFKAEGEVYSEGSKMIKIEYIENGLNFITTK